MNFTLAGSRLVSTLLLAVAPLAHAQAPAGSPATVNYQNHSEKSVIAFKVVDGQDRYLKPIQSGKEGKFDAKVGDRFVFRDPEAEDNAMSVVDLAVRKASHTVEVGPTEGLIVHDANDVPALDIRFVSSFQWVYDDHDTGAAMDCSIWRVKDDAMPKGYHSLGYLMLSTKGGGANPSGKIAVPVVKDVSPNGDALKMGLSGHRVWNDAGSGGSHDVVMYALAAPDGYKALGSYCWSSLYPHDEATKLACVRKDLVALGHFGPLVWSDAGSGADNDVRVYSAEASPVEDGFKRLNSMSFVPISPQAAVSEHASPWRNGTPSNEFARVLKFKLPYCHDHLASDLSTLPKTSEGWPSEGARTKWQLANSVSVPFQQVQDHLDLDYQLKHPIYRAEKYVCWQAFMPMLGGNQGSESHTFTNSVGIEKSSEKSFSMTTGIKVKSETEAGAEGAGLTAKEKISFEFSIELGIKTVDRTTVKTTTSHSETFTIESGTNVVFWKPIYKYVLRRHDGSLVFDPALAKAEMAKRMVYTDAQSQKAFVGYGDLREDL
jgi:hypothetical protein